MLKDVHHWLAHDHHHGEACCDIVDGTVHFHQQDSEADDCLLCHLNLSSFENDKKVKLPVLLSTGFNSLISEEIHFIKPYFYKASAPRAPPVLI